MRNTLAISELFVCAARSGGLGGGRRERARGGEHAAGAGAPVGVGGRLLSRGRVLHASAHAIGADGRRAARRACRHQGVLLSPQ